MKWALVFILIVSLLGCGTTESFHKVVYIDAEVHIVSDSARLNCNGWKPYGTAACFYRDHRGQNIIYILGNFENGQYRTQALWLGHELQELMSAENKDILNPHKYKFWMKE